MNREQAINYLFSRGFTNEQVGEVVRALTYEPARLSVDEVTALAEWTEKLTKASAEAIPKADYENRLKADMVDMLVRLTNEIDDLRAYDDIETVDKCEEIIQQEIDNLKENI